MISEFFALLPLVDHPCLHFSHQLTFMSCSVSLRSCRTPAWQFLYASVCKPDSIIVLTASLYSFPPLHSFFTLEAFQILHLVHPSSFLSFPSHTSTFLAFPPPALTTDMSSQCLLCHLCSHFYCILELYAVLFVSFLRQSGLPKDQFFHPLFDNKNEMGSLLYFQGTCN